MPDPSNKTRKSVFYIDSCVFIDFLNTASLTNSKGQSELKERHKLALVEQMVITNWPKEVIRQERLAI